MPVSLQSHRQGNWESSLIKGWQSGECESPDILPNGGHSEAFTADKLHEPRSVPGLSKALPKRVTGHLSGREEGVKGIPRTEHKIYGGTEACLE